MNYKKLKKDRDRFMVYGKKETDLFGKIKTLEKELEFERSISAKLNNDLIKNRKSVEKLTLSIEKYFSTLERSKKNFLNWF